MARLAGQDFAYLLRLLRGFKARTASDLDGTMTVATQALTDDEIVSLVHLMATLGDPQQPARAPADGRVPVGI